MKLNNLVLNHLAKTVVLGLAVLLASSAFASNKGTLQVHETLEVNGQQLPAGEYQLRWDGTGSNVEVSFMRGKKEIAKTSAKLVNLDKAADNDSALVDHSTGKAIVTEVRFAGKKYALALGATEKAEMSEGSNK
jgi:flagellar basal body P-ring protein FlgI